jgi:hypothetical protein
MGRFKTDFLGIERALIALGIVPLTVSRTMSFGACCCSAAEAGRAQSAAMTA